MKQEELEILQPDPETEAALAKMAEDVPPMPADFHSKWMNAVRAEAEKTAPAAVQESSGKTVSITGWTRILSIAATFVFLIGGTLLYRNAKNPLTASRSAEKKAAVTAAEMQVNSEAPEEVLTESAAESEYTAEDAEMDGDAGFMMLSGASTDTSKDASAAAGAAMAVYTAGAFDEAPAMEADMEEAAVYAAEENSAVPEESDPVMEIREETGSGSKAADAAEVPEPVPSVTASPTEPVPEPQETAAEQAESSSFLQDAGAFLTDMGDFLLAALPYLAVLAVPAVIALILRRRKK